LPAIKTKNDTPARLRALRERLSALSGQQQKLLPVDFSAALPPAGRNDESGNDPSQLTPGASNFHLWGFIGAPGVARSTREDQHVFVNRRPVENRGLNFALLEGYHTSLMKGRYPVCCLFLEIHPAAVDVNIHPAKREVKFHQEAEVRRLVAQAVRQRLLEFHGGDDNDARRPASAEPRTGAAGLAGAQSGAGGQAALPNFPAALKPPTAEPSSRPAAQQPALRIGFGLPQPQRGEPPASSARRVAAEAIATAHPPPVTAPEALPRQSDTPARPPRLPLIASFPPEPVPLLKVPLRLVGVIGKLYVVFESDRGLVLLDQHAAHEQILFEQMLNRLETQDQAPSQKLLLPETIEVSARDANFLREQLPALARLGVGLSEFGERTFLLDALPPFVRAAEPRRFVLELVDELKAAGQEVNALRLGEHTVAKTVCRHAVKANDPLAGPELENLVEDLRHCAMPYTCPHGRPTLIEMNFRELEKKFGRAQ